MTELNIPSPPLQPGPPVQPRQPFSWTTVRIFVRHFIRPAVSRLLYSRGGRIGLAAFAFLVLLRLFSGGGPTSHLSFSRAIYDRNGTLLRLTLSADEKYRRFIPLDGISSDVVEAVLLREDRYFYYHPGVNPVALVKASSGYLSGSDARGASTITMQLARLLYDLKTRTLAGKLKQIAVALYLEIRYSKRQILEAYLNLLPLGHNIEGIPAASMIYYRKSPDRINAVEAITLAVIPPRPSLRTSRTEEARRELSLFRRRLFEQWLERHPEDRELVIQAEQASLPEERSPLPFFAPHFTDSILLSGHGREDEETTLDLRLQTATERVLAQYVKERSSAGIYNAAALLVNTRTAEVLVQVGSADYHDASIYGQVDGTRAFRSPGSALKPLLYGLAIDQGLIHGRSVLKDAPVHFSSYSPENFEGEFLGPLPAEQALVLSRNVPAIQLGARLKSPDLLDTLQKAGVPLRFRREYYGLAPIIGGVEMTMHQLASIYAALATGGTFRSTRIRLNQASDRNQHLLSPQAAFLVMQMLGTGHADHEQWIHSPVTVYAKTGTSSAFRDAWTAGIAGPYVLVVWVGNFDGRSNPAFVGREAATPLFYRILAAVRTIEPDLRDQIQIPEGVAQIEVCAASGKIPHAFCPARVTTWFIPGKSPIEPCDVHRQIRVSRRTGLRLCDGAVDGIKDETQQEVFEFWSSDLERLFEQAGIPRRKAPPFDRRCTQQQRPERGLLQITLPLRNVVYTIEEPEQQIPLRASAPSDAEQLYWFIDEAYVGSARVDDAVFWKAHPGRFTLRAVDNLGNSDQIELRVETARERP